ncbi:hypothetical protein FB470_004575 [Amycolatopsis thermophila]|uniref:Uncharacterized protein n=1 Tax=Amycolatopsis thermophila TaxID=206084 RepID=A0ABU0EZ38_9PSEU|nr:hypothetical protein [Amycolatopsis thermophila]
MTSGRRTCAPGWARPSPTLARRTRLPEAWAPPSRLRPCSARSPPWRPVLQSRRVPRARFRPRPAARDLRLRRRPCGRSGRAAFARSSTRAAPRTTGTTASTSCGRRLLLALDWRGSDEGIAWTRGVLDAPPGLPAILTTHDLIHRESNGGAALSDHGDQVIRRFDPIFLAKGGLYWPTGRPTLLDDHSNPVHLHITNHQDRCYGGAGMLRYCAFDLVRGVIDVGTFSPRLGAARSDRPGGRNTRTVPRHRPVHRRDRLHEPLPGDGDGLTRRTRPRRPSVGRRPNRGAGPAEPGSPSSTGRGTAGGSGTRGSWDGRCGRSRS